ncbi:MAG: hypothetical protein P8Z68_03765 [Kineosporiaceae bacterium]|jgi:hypothetical protein
MAETPHHVPDVVPLSIDEPDPGLVIITVPAQVPASRARHEAIPLAADLRSVPCCAAAPVDDPEQHPPTEDGW